MGFSITKSLLLLFFISSFTAIGAHYSHPVAAPAHSPSHHHHHPHHSHPPSSAPIYPPSRHHHSHPPTHAPVYPPHHHSPSPAPVHPPTSYPPSHAPAHNHYPVAPPPQPPKSPFPPRSFISVQGVVYCKPCKYAGVDTLLGAKPVSGAIVKLVCKNTQFHPIVQTVTTDKNGYFFVTAPKIITSYAFHKCKAFLVSSKSSACKVPSDLHGGLKGATLRPSKSYFDAQKHPFMLYTVGPFAFEPSCPR